MGRACSTWCNVLHHVCAICQVLLAIAIIVVVAVKLSDYTLTSSGVDYTITCLLGNESLTSNSLCSYVYAVAAVSLVVSMFISLVQCITCYMCGLGGILDTLFAIAGTAWWAIGAGVVTSNVNNGANMTVTAGGTTWGELPYQSYRDFVKVSMWIECGLFAALVISGFARCMCRCCVSEKSQA